MRTRFAHNPLESLTGPLVQQSRLFEAEAQIRRLRAKLAAKEADTDEPVDDEVDPADVEPNAPKKKGKKTKKGGDDVDKNDDEEEQPARPDEESPEGPQEGESDDQCTKPPRDTTTKPEPLSYRARVEASVAAVVEADAKRRGVAPCIPEAASGDDGYWARVNARVDAIVAADKARRGAVESSVPLPKNPGRWQSFKHTIRRSVSRWRAPDGVKE